MVKRSCARLSLSAVILSCTGGSGVAQTTTAPAPPPAQAARSSKTPDVVVRGTRMPTAEAPKWATCEARARDPIFARQLRDAKGDPFNLPQVFQPTRMPRNPDYRAAPQVAAGSALPDLPKARFGAGYEAETIMPGYDPANAADDPSASDPTQSNDARAAARATCIAMFSRFSAGSAFPETEAFPRSPGDPSFARRSPALRTSPINAIATQGRAQVVSKDTTLPMAFALFDQGRYAESLGWFRKAAAKLDDGEGGDEANLFVGKLILAGFDKTKGPADAITSLKRAADANFNPMLHMPVFNPDNPALNTASGEAAMILATIYQRGITGVPRDMTQAIKWYRRAETVGHVAAGKTLGDIYYRGVGVPRDLGKAVDCYKRAGKLDLASAQTAMGQILEFGGDGVKPDLPQAIAWYKTAAKHEEPEALYALALAYDQGKGVPANPEFAFSYFKSAALKGLPAAQVAIGTYYQDGSIVARDDATARRWFENGARSGNSDGMYNLAALLANGRGGERDLVGAWVWMKRAAAKGHAGAITALAKLDRSMSPAQRQAAAAKLASS